MYCKNCGFPVDDMKFCVMCGTKVELVPLKSQPTPVLETAVQQNNNLLPNAPLMPPQPQNYKKAKIKKVAIVSLVIFLVCVILESMFFLPFLYTPKTKVLKALEKTLTDVSSFTLYQYYKKGNSCYYVEVEDTISVFFGDNLATTSFIYDFKRSGNEYKIAAYNGEMLLVIDAGYTTVGVGVSTGDIYNEFVKDPEKLDDYDEIFDYFYIDQDDFSYVFSNIVSNGKLNEDGFAALYDNFLRESFANRIDIDDSDIPDYETMKKLISEFVKKGLSEDTISVEKTNKKSTTTYYDVTIDIPMLMEDFVDFCEDTNIGEDFMETYLGDIFIAGIDEQKRDYKGETLEFEVGVSQGYLTELYYYSNFIDLELVLTEINQNSTKFQNTYNELYDEYEDADENGYIKDEDDLEQILFS